MHCCKSKMEIALNSVVSSSPSSASSSSSKNSSFDSTTIIDTVSVQERNLSYQNCLKKPNEGLELLASISLQNALSISNSVNNNYNLHQKRIQQPQQKNQNHSVLKKISKIQTKLTQQQNESSNKLHVISSSTTAIAPINDTTFNTNKQNKLNCLTLSSSEETIINKECSNNNDITNNIHLKLYNFDIKPNVDNLIEKALTYDKTINSSNTSSTSLHSLPTTLTTTNVNPLLAVTAAPIKPLTPTSTILTNATTSACIVNTSNTNNVANSSIINSNGIPTNAKQNTFKIPSDILDDLASRFIINVPDMELSNLIRICFQIELAHWFYLDFFCATEDEDVKLPTCGIKQFAMQIFQHIPFLQTHLSSVDKILEDWKNYKLAVPTFGAILISEDLKYCLLVQSYFAKSSWGFPKGKVNENEDPVHCATREVYEETSYDITNLIVPKDYIEAVINYQYTRLYIVRNVPLDTQFTPRTRNEIKCCDWFPIDSLPINKSDAISKTKLGINANSFFMILPFMKRLKKWVNDKRAGIDTTTLRRKCSGNTNSVGICGSPPTSNSPPLYGYSKINNNQKLLNAAINICKKNKQSQQQYTNKITNSDDILALHNTENSEETFIENFERNESTHSEETVPESTEILINLSTNFNENANANDYFVDSNALSNLLTNATFCSKTEDINETAKKTPINNQCSKRQRHKSMGDLDGVKLTNFNNKHQNILKIRQDEAISNTSNVHNNHSNSNDNCNSASTKNILMTAAANSVGNNNNYKRNLNKISAAGSSSFICINNHNQTIISNILKSNNSSENDTIGNNVPSKRQLFHSQSHSGTGTQEEKQCITLFDGIRKDKQQQKQGKSKCQKQQLNSNNNSGRTRAKSHSEKVCSQLQIKKNTPNLKINCNTTNKNILRRQQSLSYPIASFNNDNSSNENINEISNINNGRNFENSHIDSLLDKSLSLTNEKIINDSRSFTGMDLIALIEANSSTKINTTLDLATNKSLSNCATRNEYSGYSLVKSASTTTTPKQHQLEQRKQRPVSVSLNFENSAFQIEKQIHEQSCLQKSQLTQHQPSIQRLASGTNLPYLRRSISQQQQQKVSTSATAAAEGEIEHQHLKPFSPNNSWKNFTFTKNFISNVFC